MDVFVFAITIGTVYSLLALSVIFSFRILGFPDLTPDGSFIVGASTGSILLLSTNSIFLALVSSSIIGALFGILTAFLHNKLKISKLLSGILVMTMLYSVSLRIMNTSNLSLLKAKTLWISNYSESSQYINLILSVVIAAIALLVIFLLLKTNIGIQLRALGDSDTAAKNINLNIKKLNVIGLGISNGIAGIAGCIIAQYQGFVDISMGAGMVIIALASIIIGEIILKPRSVFTLLLSGIVGMIIYQGIITIALQLGLPSTDMKIATVIITILFIFVEKFRKGSMIIDRQIGNRNI